MVRDGWHRDGTFTIGGIVKSSVGHGSWNTWWADLLGEQRDGFFSRAKARAWCERKLIESGEK